MPMLVFVAGPLKGATHLLDRQDTSIGRDDTSTIPLPDPALSRQHCVLTVTGRDVTIKDLDSLNGTFINGRPVTEQVLQAGDHVCIGESVFVCVDDSEALPAAADAVPIDEAIVPFESTIQLRPEEAQYLHGALRLAPDDDHRTARDLRTLLGIGAAIHTIRGRETLQQRLLDLMLNAMSADCAAILLSEGRGAEFGSLVVRQREPQAPLEISRTVARRVLSEGVAILTNDVPTEGRFEAPQSAIDSRTRSILCAPLSVFDRTLGVVYLASREDRRRFGDEDLQLLMGIAGISAVALDNALQIEWLEAETRRLQNDLVGQNTLIGDGSRMREVHRGLAKLAAGDSTVLIRGESGTGKELAARALHANSPRSTKRFIAINCAALTESLLESELFGHEKGAFTGAIAQKLGKLEVADGGTLFLDEVGDMTQAMQVKLLRVLQEREFERVGGTRPIRVDIRLIAATNRDLEGAIRANTFRQDLYYRLNVVSLTMPPLRDRPEDIPLLANYFIAKYSAQCKRPVRGISAEARASLMRYGWPGNVRELENAIERAVVMGAVDRILQEDLPESVLEPQPPAGESLSAYHDTLNETKRRLIVSAVERSQGSYTGAAKLLGLHPNYLHRLIRNLDLKNRVTRNGA